MSAAGKLGEHGMQSWGQEAVLKGSVVRRCHCIAGYVVPRTELAFTHPTEAGSAFALAYSQSDYLLVYK